MNDQLKPVIPGGVLAAMWELFRTLDERRALEGSAPDDEDDENPALSKDAYP